MARPRNLLADTARMRQIVVSILGDREVMARLKKVGNNVLNLKTPMDEIGT